MTLVVAIVATLSVFLTIATVCLIISTIKLWVEFKAMKQSTHQIQYIDPLQEFGKVDEKVKQAFEKDPFDNIA